MRRAAGRPGGPAGNLDIVATNRAFWQTKFLSSLGENVLAKKTQ